MWEGLAALREQEEATGASLNEKFRVAPDSFVMSYGSLDDFFKGLEGLIGPPLMKDGNLLKRMETEHTSYDDADEPFSTTNGVKGATSRLEWEIVVDPQPGKRYVCRTGLVLASATKGTATNLLSSAQTASPKEEWTRRKAIPLEAFHQELAEKNRQLREMGQDQVLMLELIAGRLYTGPMYEKYNAVLRACSKQERPIQKFETLCRGNTYATTIHGINSCVIKCSKLTKLQTVYRGFAGAALPQSFFVKDKNAGFKGGVEYGFTSTTTERAQAHAYASGKSTSTVLMMQMGMVDRGADIGWLSQARCTSPLSSLRYPLSSPISPELGWFSQARCTSLLSSLRYPLSSLISPTSRGSRSTRSRRRSSSRL